MTQIELGINNCFAVKRWPKASEWAEIVSSTLELDTVQLSFDLLDPRAEPDHRSELAKEIKDACKERGVRLHSTFTGLGIYSFNLLMDPRQAARHDAIHLFENMIEVSSELGASATGGHVAAMSESDYHDEKRRAERIDQLVTALQKLSRKAAETKHSLLWEPMPIVREPPATIIEAKRLHERANRDAETRITYA